LLGLATALLAGCDASKSAGSSTIGGSANTPQPVHVATVRRQAAPLTLRAIGTVEALASVTIRAQVDGRLTRVSFDDGQEVRAGDVLFEIDPRPSQATLR
jgi:multidrug efflux system membrane fusion protein